MNGIRRRAALGIAAAATLTASLLATAGPASAHPESDLASICGSSSYYVVNDGGGIGDKAKRAVETPGGSVWGYVYLLYEPGGNNCVVTRKTAYHGTASYTSATLNIQNVGAYGDAGYDYGHYADVQHYAADRCVAYWGTIWNPAHTVRAYGGRTAFGNCG